MKGSEARPTSCIFHRCLDPGTFRSNIDSKTYQIWQSPPGSQGTEMRSVRKCLRNWVSVDKHHHISLLQASKAYLGTQSVTQDYLHSTQLNNKKPISNASHSSRPFPPLPQLSISHQQYNPPSTHQNVPPSTTTSTTAIPLLPPRRTLRPHHPGPPLPGPRSTKPNQPKIPPTV